MIPIGFILLIASGCTSSSDGSDADPQTPGESIVAGSDDDETPETTAAPVILALAENLGLLPAQCFDAVPEPTTTEPPPTTTTTTDPEAESTTTTAAPTTEPPAPTTTIAKPPTIAVVDCNGTYAGAVYAAMCIGSDLEVDAEEIIDQPNELAAVTCPGDPSLDWPGERVLLRAAARICLPIFETSFRQSYADSEIDTRELVPSRGVWERGDRRIVCSADERAQ